jgi:cellulose synthase/poly-beta-1,6-N-acetylglucosamine synthase-like glycosyltransferase
LEDLPDYSVDAVEVRPGLILKHIHRISRKGFKGGALDLALKYTQAEAEYISIFDADFVPYPDTLIQFAKYFEQVKALGTEGEKVAAVQGYQWHVLNKSENWITRGVRTEYAGSYVIERAGGEIYGGLKQISGSVYMISRKVLESIGWGSSITEDFELTLKLYERGYKVLYTPYIQAPAECVSTLKRLIRQRMRWAEGHSQNIKKMFWRLALSNKLTVAEKLELVYLAPYYLQAATFLLGTVCWFLSETVFKVTLPFWTSLYDMNKRVWL